MPFNLLRDLFKYRKRQRPRKRKRKSQHRRPREKYRKQHSSNRPFAGKRARRRAIYCSNRGVHPGGYRIHGKVYYWAGRPLCKRCYRFFTASHIKKLN